MDEVSTTSEDHPPRIKELPWKRRWIMTGSVFYGGFCYGLMIAFLGAVLIDLQQLLDVNTQKISTIFTWRGAGILIGSMLTGHLLSVLNHFLALGLSLFLLGLSYVALFFCTDFTYFCIILGLGSVCGGILGTGNAAAILDLWFDQGATYIQALFVAILMGSSICPQIPKPFLAKELNLQVYPEVYNTTTWNHTEKVHFYTNESGTEFYATSTDSQVQYTFLIIAAFMFFGAIFYMVQFCTSGCHLRHLGTPKKLKAKTMVDGKTQHSQSSSSKKLRILIIIQIGVASLLFGCLQELYGAFLVEYVVQALAWDTKMGANIASVFWATDCVSRVLAVILTKKFKVPTLLSCCVVLILIANVILVSTSSMTTAAIWVGVVGTSAGLGSISGYILVLSTVVISQNQYASILLHVGIYSGKIIFPPLVGYTFQNISYTWFIYFSLILSVLTLVDCGCLILSLYFYERKTVVKKTKASDQEKSSLK